MAAFVHQTKAQTCQANFSFSYDTSVKFKVDFTNKSYGTSSATYLWIFGDGTSSTAKNPSHTFKGAKSYGVCLIVTDTALRCYDSACKLISFGCPSQPYLTAIGTNISYSALSSGIRYHWDFGDSNTSNAYYGTHSYKTGGTYKVCLTTVCSKTDSTTACTTVTVKSGSGSGCRSLFTVYPDTNKKFTLFLVNRSSYNSTTSYSWNFGDGTGSNQRFPKHKYTKFGKYTICLTVTDSSTRCTSKYCDTIGLDSTGKLLKSGSFELEVIDESAVSIGNPVNASIKLYPNPANAELTIEVGDLPSKVSTIQVLDIHGKVCLNTGLIPTEDIIKVNIEQLPTGIYFVKLENDGQSVYSRFVKK